MKYLKCPLVPRNGHTLVVGIVARISGGQNQKELSLEDQVDHAKTEITEIYDGPVEYRVISTTGKGERLDRPELAELEAMIRSRELDILVAEDLGRIVRGTEASNLCGLAVDHGTRVIIPNDGIDTSDPSWEEDVISACRDHVGHNLHASKRIKHKSMNRFKKYGQATAREVYGYIVPNDAKSYYDWKTDESATPILLECFMRLKAGHTYSSVADWLNEQKIPVGPYTRNTTTWSRKAVWRITRNPILKGYPGRGFRKTVKVNETGRRMTIKNPDGPTFIHCPNLAHIPEQLWDEVNAIMAERNKGMGRKPLNGQDPRKGVSKKRTVWPGQHLSCGICGRIYHWGGHGVTEHMMCRGSHEYRCWNGASLDGIQAGPKLLKGILEKIEALEGFDEIFMAKVQERIKKRLSSQEDEKRKIVDELRQLEIQQENLINTIAKIGSDDRLQKRLAEMRMREKELQFRLPRLSKDEDVSLKLPTLGEIKERTREVLVSINLGNPSFCNLMRRLVPKLEVFPVQLCDGGPAVLRAHVRLNLFPLFKGLDWAIEDDKFLQIEFAIDLFNKPQRAKYLDDIVRLKAEGHKDKKIAASLGVKKPVVSYAMKLHHLMLQLGITDPYVRLTEPPLEGTKLKRHLHPRYRFEPLDGDPMGPMAI